LGAGRREAPDYIIDSQASRLTVSEVMQARAERLPDLVCVRRFFLQIVALPVCQSFDFVTFDHHLTMCSNNLTKTFLGR
jgi:hypothetical protein